MCEACRRLLAKADAAAAALFADTGCAACHVPEMPAEGGGTVAAHTDLLLHDMGAGLDDGVGEPGVASAEWRTAPLIGDGAGRRPPLPARRARCHSRCGDPRAWRRSIGRAFRAISRLSDDQRRALVAYVESL